MRGGRGVVSSPPGSWVGGAPSIPANVVVQTTDQWFFRYYPATKAPGRNHEYAISSRRALHSNWGSSGVKRGLRTRQARLRYRDLL